MTVNRLFVGYMVLVGLLIGGILVAAPQLGDFWIKPYFWVLIAAFLFDGAVVVLGYNAAGMRLAMEWRLLGFAIGIALMVIVLKLTGSPAKYF
ncbi:MAG: hypothetical protein JWN71_424 [Xanthobacteraceae bacterium]|nr:hypothetical protein [Xanthobacteraceae bacterium]